MQIRNNTLITECSTYDFKEMLERKKVKSWLKSVSAFANTEASSFFTTFYNLNWGKNERIPVEEVAERVNSPLKKYPANEESSVEKFGVNAKMFGVNDKSSETRFGESTDAPRKDSTEDYRFRHFRSSYVSRNYGLQDWYKFSCRRKTNCKIAVYGYLIS